MHNTRNSALDMIKVIATFFILFHHYHMVGWMVTGTTVSGIPFYHSVFQDGDFSWGYMVELFFLISGYLMLSYLPKIQGGMTFYQFYTRRASRLLPLMAVSSIACAAFLLLYDKAYQGAFWPTDPSIFGVVIQALGVQAGWVFQNPYLNNPTWYCSVLMLCYLLFYAITYWAQRLRISPCYGFVGMILVGCCVQSYGHVMPFLDYYSSRGFYSFFAGVLLAMAMPRLKAWRGTFWLGLAFLAVFAAAYYKKDGNLQSMPFLLTFLLYPALLVIFQRFPLTAVSGLPFWQGWARISYSVFIWHFPLYILLYSAVKLAGRDPTVLVSWQLMLVCAAVMQLVGWLSYRFLEQPLHQKALQLFTTLDPAKRPDYV